MCSELQVSAAWEWISKCLLDVDQYTDLDLTIDNYVYLDTSLGPALQNLVQPPFLVEIWGSSQEQLG